MAQYKITYRCFALILASSVPLQTQGMRFHLLEVMSSIQQSNFQAPIFLMITLGETVEIQTSFLLLMTHLCYRLNDGKPTAELGLGSRCPNQCCFHCFKDLSYGVCTSLSSLMIILIYNPFLLN